MMDSIVQAAATAAMVTLVVLVIAAVVAVRVARRRYRTLRARLQARVRAAVAPGADWLSLPVLVAAARRLPVSHPGWWSVQRDRHELWKSVHAAEHAVRAAGRADVPVGELPRLTRELRRAADRVDAALRAGGLAHDRIPGDVHRQRRQVQRTADE